MTQQETASVTQNDDQNVTILPDPDQPDEMHHDTPKRFFQGKQLRLSRSKMNTVLALCAMLISAASFYATYMQAKAAQEQVAAAERQLEAETWPWLQFNYSNFDLESERPRITIGILNSGTGPALIKWVQYQYRGQTYDSIIALFDACCNISAYRDALDSAQQDDSDVNVLAKFGWYITSRAEHSLLADGASLPLFTMQKSNFNNRLWDKIDSMSEQVEVYTCYCSLLEQCYISTVNSHVSPVSDCTAGKLTLAQRDNSSTTEH
ncbi:hypothetical protein [Pseudoalteromonas ardens]|uniref:Uncharacterized protein n=1 Tax=Pseudoalteromonas rubra TaxID=43658 RepID=A0A0L0EQJ0_9GAMM|nr:hypothetical protein [Pseudoalteromonas sp. R96]KNC66148.1 hypothetical protein AC626_18730 [Pseudoalteromonas rubra]MDK1313837.1 hypothetical protein [Pseudoalteromonas sp. R96]